MRTRSRESALPRPEERLPESGPTHEVRERREPDEAPALGLGLGFGVSTGSVRRASAESERTPPRVRTRPGGGLRPRRASLGHAVGRSSG
ncbi:hypothetical protein ABZ725_43475 [Streptomyces sp. NPDC006872]|uniref:hypothetical protein n=1 Tax=Streptomyces sp. NPDC006872 TaxID=3155720 RepID=UPI0033D81889